jgi:hypothetical protein
MFNSAASLGARSPKPAASLQAACTHRGRELRPGKMDAGRELLIAAR